MKKKVLTAMILATAICSTTFAAEVPARGESSKDASFASSEIEVVEMASKDKKVKKEINKGKTTLDKNKNQKDLDKARQKADEERRLLEKERLEHEKKSINLMPTQSQEYSFDNEFAIDGAVTGMAHRVAHNLIPLSVEARFFAPHFDAKVHADSISYNGGTIGLKDQCS